MLTFSRYTDEWYALKFVLVVLRLWRASDCESETLPYNRPPLAITLLLSGYVLYIYPHMRT
jgi:hypothetical protein